jgi:DUF4097 and DUF4098 domain-containing protein YvlB
VGWARPEVKVATPSPDWLRVTSSDDHAQISIRADGGGGDACEVFVPAAARVDVDVVSGGVSVRDVTGAIRASSVEGRVEVSGSAREVEAHSVAGGVDVKITETAPASQRAIDLRASSVSGEVRVRAGGLARVWAKTVSGPVNVAGAGFERVQMRSVSGSITFDGRPNGDGPFELRTHSGSIEVTLPKGTSPSLDIHTFSGQVTKGATDGGASKTVLTVSTFSGSIRIKP